MIIGAVPLYNIFAVIILTVECPEKGAGQSKTLSSTLKGIATNPIILSIVAGVILSVLNVHFPKVLDNTISNFSKIERVRAMSEKSSRDNFTFPASKRERSSISKTIF